MTKTTKKALAYKKAYNARPEIMDRRVKNNAARRDAIAKGIAHVGDGKDVGHKVPLDAGGGNTPGNLELESRKENRGWRRGQSGYSPKTTK